MAETVMISERKPGFAGKLFKALFWIWNVLMLVWLVAWFVHIGNEVPAATEAGRLGQGAGKTIAFGMLMSFWGFGCIIFGGLMLATRGALITRTITKAQA